MLRVRAVLASGLLLLAAVASAQGQSCSFTMPSFDFGTIDVTTGAAFTTTGTFMATCTGVPVLTARLCPSIGEGTGGSNGQGSPRLLLDGAGHQLQFTFYQPNTSVWGSWVWPYAATFPGPQFDLQITSVSGNVYTATVTGTVLAGQTSLPPGVYASSFAGSNTSFAYANALLGIGASCATIGSTNAVQVPFTVRATIGKNCTISSGTLDFGTRGVLAADIDAATTVTATCSSGVAYTIGLDFGQNVTGTQRRMKGGGGGSEFIAYNLYTDLSRSALWQGATLVSRTGTGNAQSIDVAGRVPAQTTPSPGTYTDSVVMTVTY
jgi:spore coat protein U-like protein